jgi:hypothetical protein
MEYAPFPLTLALSLGEREPRSPAFEYPKRLGLDGKREMVPPLPKGEGRGEGEDSVLTSHSP